MGNLSGRLVLNGGLAKLNMCPPTPAQKWRSWALFKRSDEQVMPSFVPWWPRSVRAASGYFRHHHNKKYALGRRVLVRGC